jgi:hypothetical protein
MQTGGRRSTRLLTTSTVRETVSGIEGVARRLHVVAAGAVKGGMVAQRKKPDREVKQELERRLEEIELLRQQAQQQGLAFSAPTSEQLEKKIRGEAADSPYIYSMSWTSSAAPGSAAYYQVWMSNPDAVGYYPVFVSVFFGVANFFDSIADGIIARDDRWPYLSSPPFSFAAGATATQSFNYTTPSTVPRSTYLGNAVVWRGEFHDKGVYFDRGLFYVTVV